MERRRSGGFSLGGCQSSLSRWPRARSPTVSWSAGSKAAWNGDLARWAIVRSSAIRHEGHPQRQDQTPGILSPLCALCPARSRCRWFVRDDDVPFMLQVIAIRPERRGQIPAVTHVDGTGRLQTVDRIGNSRYHALIEAFFRMTGVPIVVNTSFNENEPVVCRPEEALDCFLRTKMDVLVLGNHIVRRTAETAP
jgi:hypothetical protein